MSPSSPSQGQISRISAGGGPGGGPRGGPAGAGGSGGARKVPVISVSSAIGSLCPGEGGGIRLVTVCYERRLGWRGARSRDAADARRRRGRAARHRARQLVPRRGRR